MTLQTENGAPSFYTIASFRPNKTALLYGGLLSILAFCAIALVFNYGIRERLWSYQSGGVGVISFSSAAPGGSAPASTPEKIPRVQLPEHVLLSLTGAYFSAEANRTYRVSLQQGQLGLEMDKSPMRELIPVADDTLYAGQGHMIKFTPTLTGSIDRLDLYDNGRHIVAHRSIKPTSGPAAKSLISAVF